jgi:hypothetical protein
MRQCGGLFDSLVRPHHGRCMCFTNEYVPPLDTKTAKEFINRTLLESRSKAEPRKFPHPLEHYSAHEHRLNEFVITAREKLRKGHSIWDMWTIDHERELVLTHLGWPRREIDESNDCNWEFISSKARYRLNTTQLLSTEISPGEMCATYRINFFWDLGQTNCQPVPEDSTMLHIKEAIDEFHRYSLFDFNAYQNRKIRLINCRDGKDI